MLKVKEPTVKARIRYGLNKLSILLKGKRQMEKSSNEISISSSSLKV